MITLAKKKRVVRFQPCQDDPHFIEVTDINQKVTTKNLIVNSDLNKWVDSYIKKGYIKINE